MKNDSVLPMSATTQFVGTNKKLHNSEPYHGLVPWVLILALGLKFPHGPCHISVCVGGGGQFSAWDIRPLKQRNVLPKTLCVLVRLTVASFNFMNVHCLFIFDS